jgi:hypothetical protein
VVVLIGLVAIVVTCWMASRPTASLLLDFQKWLGLLTSGLVGVFLMGIFLPRIGQVGAIAGALVSSAALWWVADAQIVNLYLYPVIGIGACIIAGFIASFLEPKKDTEGLTYWTLSKLPEDKGEAPQSTD